MGKLNRYSASWFDTFLPDKRASATESEITFIHEHMPCMSFPKVLDIACGIGRHAHPLAASGYTVLGIDREPKAIDAAKTAAPEGAEFRVMDIRDLDELSQDFDCALCLWQSFGYGDLAENTETLASMSRRLRIGGRLLLDLYNAEALNNLPARSTARVAQRTVSTHRRLLSNRFRVDIEYEGLPDSDCFEWQVFTVSELEELGKPLGLDLLFACAWFDEEMPAGPLYPRMQLLFERRLNN